MRFLVVGLGSMGKRRIRNLQYLKAGDIVGYDPRSDRRQEAQDRYGIQTFTEIGRAMDTEPDALVISTPPDLHSYYACLAVEHNKHFFTEVNVVLDGMDELIATCDGRGIVAAPSCTGYFQPSIRLIKSLIDSNSIGPILAFTYHVGQYLPDWHPWEDYRTFYVAKRETGACREILAFELTWLTWLFGEAEMASCFKDKLSNLDVDIDDVYQVLLRFKRKTSGHILVDAISRVPYRTFRLLSEYGVIDWSWTEKTVRVYRADEKKWREYPEPEGFVQEGYLAAENMYIDEMQCFLQAIRGETSWPYTLTADKKNLELLYAADQSSDQLIHIQVDRNKDENSHKREN
jgi:predicted dehydrogenase